MGRRFWLGIFILVLFLLMGLGAAWGMKKIHFPGETALAQAADQAMAGDLSAAGASAMEAYDRWVKTRDLTASLADHAPMDDVEKLFAEMQVYADTGETPHFIACCRQLRVMLRAMYDAHSPSLWNFL